MPDSILGALLYALFLLVLVGLGFWMGMRTTLKSLAEMPGDRFLDIARGLREEEQVDLSAFKEKQITRMIMSAHGDMILAHDHSTGQFIAQGKTSLELIQAALERFPDRVFTVAVGEEVADQ